MFNSRKKVLAIDPGTRQIGVSFLENADSGLQAEYLSI